MRPGGGVGLHSDRTMETKEIKGTYGGLPRNFQRLYPKGRKLLREPSDTTPDIPRIKNLLYRKRGSGWGYIATTGGQ